MAQIYQIIKLLSIFDVMVKSVLSKTQRAAFIFFAVLCIVIGLSFTTTMSDQEWLAWGNKCLAQCFDASADGKLKKWEVNLTDESFIRLRKTYQNGKQEYFSMHLQRLQDVAYLGTVQSGTLELKAKSDDIIVQTYNDRKGNVDTMASVLTIPLKNMEPERLDSLKAALDYFKLKAL